MLASKMVLCQLILDGRAWAFAKHKVGRQQLLSSGSAERMDGNGALVVFFSFAQGPHPCTSVLYCLPSFDYLAAEVFT